MFIWLRSMTVGVLLALVCGTSVAVAQSRQADPGSAEQIYQRALRSTVWVVVPQAREGSKIFVSTGAGALIDARHGLVITNYHVVADRDEVVVFFPMFKKN